MTNKELQALRSLCNLSVSEAAEHVANASTRAWQLWEQGKRNVPNDVSDKMKQLARKRSDMIDTAESLINEKNADKVEVEYDLTLNDYRSRHKLAGIIDWRLAQSVAAHLLASNKALVK